MMSAGPSDMDARSQRIASDGTTRHRMYNRKPEQHNRRQIYDERLPSSAHTERGFLLDDGANQRPYNDQPHISEYTHQSYHGQKSQHQHTHQHAPPVESDRQITDSEREYMLAIERKLHEMGYRPDQRTGEMTSAIAMASMDHFVWTRIGRSRFRQRIEEIFGRQAPIQSNTMQEWLIAGATSASPTVAQEARPKQQHRTESRFPRKSIDEKPTNSTDLSTGIAMGRFSIRPMMADLITGTAEDTVRTTAGIVGAAILAAARERRIVEELDQKRREEEQRRNRRREKFGTQRERERDRGNTEEIPKRLRRTSQIEDQVKAESKMPEEEKKQEDETPPEQCKYFPMCSKGSSCPFFHPDVPCRFKSKCRKLPLCNYNHKDDATGSTASSPTESTESATIQSQLPTAPASPVVPAAASSIPTLTIACRYGQKCRNQACPFLHLVDVPCRFGLACQRADCVFTHPGSAAARRPGVVVMSRVLAPCRFANACANPACPYQHPFPSAKLAGAAASLASASNASFPSMVDEENSVDAMSDTASVISSSTFTGHDMLLDSMAAHEDMLVRQALLDSSLRPQSASILSMYRRPSLLSLVEDNDQSLMSHPDDLLVYHPDEDDEEDLIIQCSSSTFPSL